MTRPDANPIALRAIRSVLDAAHPFETTVVDASVGVDVGFRPEEAWQSAARDLTEAEDGPWPRGVDIRASWRGGAAELVLDCYPFRGRPHHGLLGLRLALAAPRRELVWITVPLVIADHEDGDECNVSAWFNLSRRRQIGDEDVMREASALLKRLVGESGLPLLSGSSVLACKIRLPDGEVLPDPQTAFERLVRLALYKLDFLDTGASATRRGQALIDHPAIGSLRRLSGSDSAGDSGDDAAAESDEPTLDREAASAPPLNLILHGPPGTGKTYRIQTEYVPRFASSDAAEPASFEFVTFHQSFGYEDFIEGIRPDVVDDADPAAARLVYRLEDGVFARAAAAALRRTGFAGTLDEFCRLGRSERRERLAGAPRHALFIDEINRGNVSRIFGELITLIEADKRLGEPNEIIVTLPYSRRRFGVPSNLHVIGTMNTADRSVEALDTALRRRFEFREIAPQPELLDGVVVEGGVVVARLLATINARIAKLLDRDHRIGHAYLMPLRGDPSLDLLKRIFRCSILPLLQEYFFGDQGRIGLVLGREFVAVRDAHGPVLAEFPHADSELLEQRVGYELVDVDTLSNLSFRRIYENVADDD